jgi:hypothetical protein
VLRLHSVVIGPELTCRNVCSEAVMRSKALITHLSALYKRVAMPSQRHLCASNS